jgi:hypothetical protein
MTSLNNKKLDDFDIHPISLAVIDSTCFSLMVWTREVRSPLAVIDSTKHMMLLKNSTKHLYDPTCKDNSILLVSYACVSTQGNEKE